MVILILLFLMVPVHAAESSVPWRERPLLLKRLQVLQADQVFIQARLDLQKDTKEREAEKQRAVDEMLFELCESHESLLSFRDIDFCFLYEPDIHTSKYKTPLISAAESNITMVRELIKAGADVNQAKRTILAEHTTALMAAFSIREDSPNIPILLEAGATMPYDLNLAEGQIGLRMWRNEDILAHRQKMITTVDDASVYKLPLSVIDIIVHYAFGKPPKIDSETGIQYYSEDEEVSEGDER